MRVSHGVIVAACRSDTNRVVGFQEPLHSSIISAAIKLRNSNQNFFYQSLDSERQPGSIDLAPGLELSFDVLAAHIA